MATEAKMSDLLQRLKQGSAATKMVMWPGTKQGVLMHVLSQQEHQDATFATERLFKSDKIDVNLVTANEYESEQVTQMLYRALRDPEKPQEPIASSITDFRRALTKDEKKYISDEYLAFESEISPSPDNLSNDEFDKLLSDLKKNASQTVGSISSTATLKKLLLTMASQPPSVPLDS